MSAQKATECYQLLWRLQHLWETVPSSKKCGRGSWILVHQYPQTENEMQESRAEGKMIAKRKSAAHQNGVCWSLPAQSMRERGLEREQSSSSRSSCPWWWLCMGFLTTGTTKQLLRSSPSPRDCNPNTSACVVMFSFCDSTTKKRSIPSWEKINKQMDKIFLQKAKNIFTSYNFSEGKDLPTIFFLDMCCWFSVPAVERIKNNADFLVSFRFLIIFLCEAAAGWNMVF